MNRTSTADPSLSTVEMSADLHHNDRLQVWEIAFSMSKIALNTHGVCLSFGCQDSGLMVVIGLGFLYNNTVLKCF